MKPDASREQHERLMTPQEVDRAKIRALNADYGPLYYVFESDSPAAADAAWVRGGARFAGTPASMRLILARQRADAVAGTS